MRFLGIVLLVVCGLIIATLNGLSLATLSSTARKHIANPQPAPVSVSEDENE